MSGLSTALNAAAGAINGARQEDWAQNQESALEAQRADQQLQMAANQQTYQPAADARNAQLGLSTAQAQGATSLVPQQTQLASTQLTGQQTQAQTQNGFSSAQYQQLPQTLSDLKAQGNLQDQQLHLTALNGLYNSMMSGPEETKQYVQKMADAGFYPNLQGKQIANVGLTPDGQNFVAEDAQGNTLFALPKQTIIQAHQMALPTEWHTVGDTLYGTQGPNITQQQSAPKFNALKPGETGVITQGNTIGNTTQAPVPDAFNTHQGVTVNTANWLMKNVPGMKPQDAFNMAKQAQTMSRSQFVATIMGNPMLNTSMGNPSEAAQRFGSIYDQLQQQGNSAPGLSSMPASNTSGNPIIDSLIGQATGQPGLANPYQPTQ